MLNFLEHTLVFLPPRSMQCRQYLNTKIGSHIAQLGNVLG